MSVVCPALHDAREALDAHYGQHIRIPQLPMKKSR